MFSKEQVVAVLRLLSALIVDIHLFITTAFSSPALLLSSQVMNGFLHCSKFTCFCFILPPTHEVGFYGGDFPLNKTICFPVWFNSTLYSVQI